MIYVIHSMALEESGDDMKARVQLKCLIDALQQSFRRRGQPAAVGIAGMLQEGYVGRAGEAMRCGNSQL